MQYAEPELDDLYRELILDHYRHPRHKGKLEHATSTAEGYNPLCGDEIGVDLIVEGDVIKNVGFHGRGCSISQASGSMMADAIVGKTKAEARHLLSTFTQMMTQPENAPDEDVGDLEALQGVAKFPVRVKCATLAWRVLEDGLEQSDGDAAASTKEG